MVLWTESMVTVHWAHGFIKRGLSKAWSTLRSNPCPWFHHGRCTMAGAVKAVRDGGSRWRHGRQQWLVGLGPRACYSSPNPTWFVPTVSQQDGDFVSLTFKRQRVAWRAGGGDFLHKNLADDVGLLSRLPGLTKTTGSFPLTSSSFPPHNELARAVADSCAWRL
jgi:hypothetical protein